MKRNERSPCGQLIKLMFGSSSTEVTGGEWRVSFGFIVWLFEAGEGELMFLVWFNGEVKGIDYKLINTPLSYYLCCCLRFIIFVHISPKDPMRSCLYSTQVTLPTWNQSPLPSKYLSPISYRWSEVCFIPQAS